MTPASLQLQCSQISTDKLSNSALYNSIEDEHYFFHCKFGMIFFNLSKICENVRWLSTFEQQTMLLFFFLFKSINKSQQSAIKDGRPALEFLVKKKDLSRTIAQHCALKIICFVMLYLGK